MGSPSAEVTIWVLLDLTISNDRAGFGCREQNGDFKPAPQAALGLIRPSLITSISFELERNVVLLLGCVAEVILPDGVGIDGGGNDLVHTTGNYNGHRKSKDELVELIGRRRLTGCSLDDHLAHAGLIDF